MLIIIQLKMLTKLYKEHQVKQKQQRIEIEAARSKALKDVSVVSDGMMDSVNRGVAVMFSNQKKLEEQTRRLEAQSERFAKQTEQWLAMTSKFYDALKELGDVENWAGVIERDMRAITISLEYIHKEQSTQPVYHP